MGRQPILGYTYHPSSIMIRPTVAKLAHFMKKVEFFHVCCFLEEKNKTSCETTIPVWKRKHSASKIRNRVIIRKVRRIFLLECLHGAYTYPACRSDLRWLKSVQLFLSSVFDLHSFIVYDRFYVFWIVHIFTKTQKKIEGKIFFLRGENFSKKKIGHFFCLKSISLLSPY